MSINVLSVSLTLPVILLIAITFLIFIFLINLRTIYGYVLCVHEIKPLSEKEALIYLASSLPEPFDPLPSKMIKIFAEGEDREIPAVIKSLVDISLSNGKIITRTHYFELKNIPKNGDIIKVPAFVFFKKEKILFVL